MYNANNRLLLVVESGLLICVNITEMQSCHVLVVTLTPTYFKYRFEKNFFMDKLVVKMPAHDSNEKTQSHIALNFTANSIKSSLTVLIPIYRVV